MEFRRVLFRSQGFRPAAAPARAPRLRQRRGGHVRHAPALGLFRGAPARRRAAGGVRDCPRPTIASTYHHFPNRMIFPKSYLSQHAQDRILERLRIRPQDLLDLLNGGHGKKIGRSARTHLAHRLLWSHVDESLLVAIQDRSEEHTSELHSLMRRSY